MLLRGNRSRGRRGRLHGADRALRDMQPHSVRSEQREHRAGAQRLARRRERGRDGAARLPDGANRYLIFALALRRSAQ